MLDFSRLPQIAPERLLDSDPLTPAAGPMRLCLEKQPQREGPAVLRECFARIGFRYEMDKLRDVPFQADLALNMLPNILIMEGTLHGSRNRRTRALVEGDTEDAVLLINLEGPHLIEQGGRETVLGDGEAILISSADPSSFTHRPPGKVLGLRLPKSRLAPLLNGGECCFMQRIHRGDPALHLLTNYIGLTWDARLAGNAELQHLMAGHIVDLMAAVLGAAKDAAHAATEGGLRAARLNLVKKDIARTLHQPDLSVQMLASRHHSTPRSIQRLFEAEGTTFTRYLLEQRLARACQILSDPRRAGEKISSVAFDCGFGDVSYFNRTFRHCYGAAPSDIREQVLKGVNSRPALTLQI